MGLRPGEIRLRLLGLVPVVLDALNSSGYASVSLGAGSAWTQSGMRT